MNPSLCRQSHLSFFQYWCPLCLWIIWLSSALWPSSPCQIGHLGQRPVDNAILIDGFHSLIVSRVFSSWSFPTQLKEYILDESEFKLRVALAGWFRYDVTAAEIQYHHPGPLSALRLMFIASCITFHGSHVRLREENSPLHDLSHLPIGLILFCWNSAVILWLVYSFYKNSMHLTVLHLYEGYNV